MLNPQANKPRKICQNGRVRITSLTFRLSAGAVIFARPAAISCGARSACSGASSRITNRATGIENAAKAAANPNSVTRQPADSMARVNNGVMIAMPAIEPVDRKNSAMPRRRVNQ
jgi:type IV secretory pathway VirB10-like protein